MKPSETLRYVELRSGKGASNWLTASPIDSHGLCYTKKHFVMHSTSGMDGFLIDFQPNVNVE